MTCGRWSRPSWRMLGHSCWRAGQPPPTHSGRPPGKRVQLIIFPDPERILRNPASGCRTFSKHVSPTGVFQRRKDVDLKIIPILQYIVFSSVLKDLCCIMQKKTPEDNFLNRKLRIVSIRLFVFPWLGLYLGLYPLRAWWSERWRPPSGRLTRSSGRRRRSTTCPEAAPSSSPSSF